MSDGGKNEAEPKVSPLSRISRDLKPGSSDGDFEDLNRSLPGLIDIDQAPVDLQDTGDDADSSLFSMSTGQNTGVLCSF